MSAAASLAPEIRRGTDAARALRPNVPNSNLKRTPSEKKRAKTASVPKEFVVFKTSGGLLVLCRAKTSVCDLRWYKKGVKSNLPV